MNLANKAASIAKRARTRQNARNDEPATQVASRLVEPHVGPLARSQWYVLKASGELVDVIFHPAVTAQQARERFYPDAKAIVHGD